MKKEPKRFLCDECGERTGQVYYDKGQQLCEDCWINVQDDE